MNADTSAACTTRTLRPFVARLVPGIRIMPRVPSHNRWMIPRRETAQRYIRERDLECASTQTLSAERLRIRIRIIVGGGVIDRFWILRRSQRLDARAAGEGLAGERLSAASRGGIVFAVNIR